MATNNLKTFYPALKKFGFKRVHRGRSDQDCHIYERECDDRILDLQLWPSGKHRVSHWHQHVTGSKRGAMNTSPTYFTDKPSLYDALIHECSRMDGIYKSRQLAAKVAGELK